MGCELCRTLETDRDRIIYQDDRVFVMVNLEPVKEGHVMILPIRHAQELKDLTPEESQSFLRAVDMCMAAVNEAYGQTPMCLVNGWKHRSQAHLHAHVLPSKEGLRGLYVAAEGVEERKRADLETLKNVADRLKTFFK